MYKRQLQNQINPHFLYNTLEGIRSEALIAGLDSIAEMTEALATFFRYPISNLENLVTLEDELANIENYYYIQQFRFGSKPVSYTHLDVYKRQAPRLPPYCGGLWRSSLTRRPQTAGSRMTAASGAITEMGSQ